MAVEGGSRAVAEDNDMYGDCRVGGVDDSGCGAADAILFEGMSVAGVSGLVMREEMSVGDREIVRSTGRRVWGGTRRGDMIGAWIKTTITTLCGRVP